MSKLLDDLQGRYIGVDENPEYDQEVLNVASDKRKTCALCGKSFIKNRRAVYCTRQHYTTCVNCGSRMDLIPIYFRAGFVPKTCCKACADIVGAQTLKDNCLEKYGVTNPMYVQEFADKCFVNAHPDLDLSMRNATETRNCEVCGKEFTVARTDPKKCCSVECASALRAKHVSETVKICKWCGKEFTSPNGKSAYCVGPHYQTCVVCGTSFELKNLDNPAQTCSMECKNKLIQCTNLTKYGVEWSSQNSEIRQKISSTLKSLHPYKIRVRTHQRKDKICILCGAQFTPSACAQRVCSGKHYRSCDYCGKPFVIARPSSSQRCCSKQCTELKRQTTMLDRYGVIASSQSPILRAKAEQTTYLHYGVKYASQAESVKDKIKNTCKQRYGVEHPFQSPVVQAKVRQSCRDKYGVDYVTQTEAFKRQGESTCLQKYGVRRPIQNPDIQRKNWDARKAIRGSDGTPLDSSWEKLVYDFWVSLGLSVERNIPIEYTYNNVSHVTYVDFRVNGVFYEVKGPQLLTSDSISPSGVPISAKLQVYQEHNVVVISDTSVSHLFADGSLVGLDLDLFRDIPGSSYDAKSRWTIIEYLIKHKKGFISLPDFQ